ncbi:MAG: bifunctional phosphoribosylaminoimidazolecarboxamide formyltransferase/IMP cyclohydrolase [Tissierellia bacterium]|nr:bifunctional phosphoribosylaminoimidazolecarboxamide formyltransferase/IMP cyclohydrolase [Tissierellia bacterium]
MKYALLSVTDKTGIVDFAKGLVEEGFSLLSTGGTLKALKEGGLDPLPVEDYIGFPEILDGRVKTLHPKVHGGILFRREDPSHQATVKDHDIHPIDLVCINLYPFEEKLKEGQPEEVLVENIDIGGPSMIRSAAKNFRDVAVVTQAKDYEEVLERIREDRLDLAYRRDLARKAFSLTAYYDAMISRYFIGDEVLDVDYITYGLKRDSGLRYGENPAQGASLYTDPFEKSFLSDFVQYQGKELSFNNINDLNTALELAAEFDPESEGIASVAVKHATPCGVALDKDPLRAYQKSFQADPLSIFGGIVAFNGVIDEDVAKEMTQIFLEVVAARDFTEAALEVFKAKPNMRILKIDFDRDLLDRDMKWASGKVLIQDKDKDVEEGYEIVTKEKPTANENRDLTFAMKVAKYARSNAIVIVKDGRTLGIGGGQTSRIWALRNIFTNNPDRDFTGAALASDAFFPFDDCVTLAAEHGVKTIIQPGGSIRDEDSIKACDANGMAMVFTGSRHFRH